MLRLSLLAEAEVSMLRARNPLLTAFVHLLVMLGLQRVRFAPARFPLVGVVLILVASGLIAAVIAALF